MSSWTCVPAGPVGLGLDPQQLLAVVPLVQRLGLVEPLVALQPHELAAQVASPAPWPARSCRPRPGPRPAPACPSRVARKATSAVESPGRYPPRAARRRPRQPTRAACPLRPIIGRSISWGLAHAPTPGPVHAPIPRWGHAPTGKASTNSRRCRAAARRTAARRPRASRRGARARARSPAGAPRVTAPRRPGGAEPAWDARASDAPSGRRRAAVRRGARADPDTGVGQPDRGEKRQEDAPVDARVITMPAAFSLFLSSRR